MMFFLLWATNTGSDKNYKKSSGDKHDRDKKTYDKHVRDK